MKRVHEQPADSVQSCSRQGLPAHNPGTTKESRDDADLNHLHPVTRACCSCRERKVKCDRKNPCKNCVVSFRDCIYPEARSRKRKRLRTSETVESLKTRIEALESCIKSLARPAKPNPTPPALEGQKAGRSRPSHLLEHSSENLDEEISRTAPKFILTQHAIEEAEDEFQGYSGDRAFIQRMRERIKDWRDENLRSRIRPSNSPTAKLFDCDYSLAATACLPSKERARALVDAAVESYPLFPVLHRPSFERSFDNMYAMSSNNYSADQLRFLPLLYALLAQGCMFIQLDSTESSREQEMTEGLQYFAASRAFIDIADCTNETSLQTMIYLILFTLGTARAGTCYSYVTHALTLALRMGLHHSKPLYDDLIEREVGKRIFWVLRLLTNYFATACGMPRLLSDENVDQDLPVEANDACITKTIILPQPPGEVCAIAGLNAIIALHKILDRVVKDIYPARGASKTNGTQAATYLVSIEKVKDMERALKKWMESLPSEFRLKLYLAPRSLLRTQYLLYMSHAHVQLYLYRPFLHYLPEAPTQNTLPSNIAFSPYALACVHACHVILSCSGEMYQLDLLRGGGFSVLHMVFASIVTLMFVILDSSNWEGRELALKDISVGRKAIAVLAKRNIVAERAQVILETMISLLPTQFAETRECLQRQDLSVTDLVVGDGGQANPSLGGLGVKSRDFAAVSMDEMSASVSHPTQSTSPLRLSRHSLASHEYMKNNIPGYQAFTVSPPGSANTNFTSEARVEDGTFSTSLHQEAMQDNLQGHLPPEVTMPFDQQDGGGGGDKRLVSPPYGNPTNEFLEAQHCNFSANYLGDVWSNMNQLPESIESDQVKDIIQMMDMPNFMSFPSGGLFNLGYPP